MRLKVVGTFAAAALAAGLARPAEAQAASGAESAEAGGTIVEGHVVEIQNKDVIIDLARKHDLRNGDVLEIWRPLKVRHPVTRQTLEDRFRIGSIRISQVLDVMSFTKPAKKMFRQPEVGDVVILRRAAPAPVVATSSVPQTADTAVAARPTDVEALRVADIFSKLRGTSPEHRINVYVWYVRNFPASEYVAFFREEAELLKRSGGQVSPTPHSTSVELTFLPPSSALIGAPLELGLHVTGEIRGAVIHSRNRGEVTFVSSPMVSRGPGYFSATFGAARMVSPSFEYFVEVVTATGKTRLLVGSARTPERITLVQTPEAKPPPKYASKAAIMTDYADYNRMRGDDRAWQTEGYFGMRFRDVGVRAARSGFGVYRGVGGSIYDLDELDLDGRRIGLTYGYLEGEFGFNKSVSVIGRLVMGLGDDGVSSGVQAHLRLGSDLDSNFTVGGEVLGGVGLRGIVQLELEPESDFPVILRSEVTNQPAGAAESDEEAALAAMTENPMESLSESDVGVRLIGQFGYRVVPSLVLGLRASYQGRNINHSGPGFGGAVEYSW
ncbi:MAG: hypothetical protein HRU17_08900 [Polyangiaceae bacterium]|nr:hypothetical protein [Polyangiaceae bacterium]